MFNEQKFIDYDFKLPNHDNELMKAEEAIQKLKNKFIDIQKKENINGKQHDDLYNNIIAVLDYVGKLSIPVFHIEDDLEKMYILQYPKQSALAKKLWLDHYDTLHHPYTILKNRCYRLLEELDKEYIKQNKKYPPNWKI